MHTYLLVDEPPPLPPRTSRISAERQDQRVRSRAVEYARGRANLILLDLRPAELGKGAQPLTRQNDPCPKKIPPFKDRNNDRARMELEPLNAPWVNYEVSRVLRTSWGRARKPKLAHLAFLL